MKTKMKTKMKTSKVSSKITMSVIDCIAKQMRHGDFVLLSQLLDISRAAAKKRLLRGNKAAIAAMLAIIENRERLIKEYQSKNK